MKSASDYNDKLELLERSVMELGSEVYGLRSTVTKGRRQVEEVLSVFHGLKQLLDEKGLITIEDFDAAIELGEVIEKFQINFGTPADDMEKLKKTGH